MALENLGDDSLRRIIDIKNNAAETAREVASINKEFTKLGQQAVNVSRNFSQIAEGANKFKSIQENATKSSKATSDAIKEQAKQQNIVRELNLQIEGINSRALKVNEKQARVLYAQADTLNNAKFNAKELANEFGKLAQDAASIDRKTEFFTGLSEVVKDIPGLRKLSGPFQEAAKAARETVLSNAKAVDIQGRLGGLSKEALKNGKGLTSENLKQMNLTDITNGKTGPEAAKLLRSAKATAKTQSVGLAGMSAGFKALGPLIRVALGPIGWIIAAVSAVKAIVGAMFEASKQVANFQRNMYVSSESAEQIRQNTYAIANNVSAYADTNEKVLLLQKSIVEQLGAMNSSLGIAMDLTTELGKEFGGQLLAGSAILKENMNLSADAIGSIGKESVLTGKKVSTISQEMMGVVAVTSLEKGIMLDVNEVMEEVGKTSGELRLNFKDNNKELSRGVTLLKMQGYNLNNINNASKSLLDFESSIAAEMKAELLTGMELNLEAARREALNGNLVGVAKELNKQGMTYNKLERMNVIQREAYAEAVGMSVNDLSDSLKKQKEYNAIQSRALTMGVRIADVEKQSLKEIYEKNKGIIGTEEEMIKLLGDEVYKKKLAEDAQQKFNKVLEKAKDIFASFVNSGDLDRLAGAVTRLVDFVVGSDHYGESVRIAAKENKKELTQDQQRQLEISEKAIKNQSGFFDYFLAAISGPQIGAIINANNTARDAMASVGKSTTQQLVTDLNSSKIEKYDDFIMRPGKPPIKFNKGDLIMGGTNLGGGGNGEVTALLKELISSVKSGGNVYLDGTKVGTAMNVSTYRVQ